MLDNDNEELDFYITVNYIKKTQVWDATERANLLILHLITLISRISATKVNYIRVNCVQ